MLLWRNLCHWYYFREATSSQSYNHKKNSLGRGLRSGDGEGWKKEVRHHGFTCNKRREENFFLLILVILMII
jgi:hypothetical protein